MDDIIENYTEGDLFTYTIKVPADRIAVFIGKEGSTKKELETLLECGINVDSKEGEILVSSKDSYKLMISKNLILAIARGFNPEVAKKLLKDDYFFELINLNDYNANKNHHQRLKGRVIGRNGRSRSLIEEYTGCFISIYGKTISIIGRGEGVRIAHKAIDSLLTGSPHAYVYKWLEKEKQALLALEGPSF